MGILSCRAQIKFDTEIAARLAKLPLKCLNQEFPNKTGHSADNATDAVLQPHQLHPSFYGCFDWHSSVHGHWMLVKLLKSFPDMEGHEAIIAALDNSLQPDKLKAEAAYFEKYELGKIFERTYGWAWLLQLDTELATWDNPNGRKWHKNLAPLSRQIMGLWKAYLPKATYPNRTGVHPNSAFAISFAIDWARANADKDFEEALIAKAKEYYLGNTDIPAYLEPDGTDFFSPSLEAADVMLRILPPKEFEDWLSAYYSKRSWARVLEMPLVSDRTDYQITHLDGLMLTRSWVLKHISDVLPNGHPNKAPLKARSAAFLSMALSTIDQGNYGGEHWLASFAVYALSAWEKDTDE